MTIQNSKIIDQFLFCLAFSKLLEQIMYDRLLKFIEKNNIVSEQQYGLGKVAPPL